MLLIVADSFSLSSQNATLEEKAARAEVWARVLLDLIPANRLQDAFDRAFAEHSSPFPVNAYEIKAAWEAIKAEERTARLEAEAEDRKTNAPKHCPEKSMHVNEHGDITVADPMDRSKDLVIPCPACRPKANEQARERHQKKNGVKYDPSERELIEAIPIRPTHLSIPETALEIIAKAKDEVGRDILKDPDNGDLRQAHDTLTNAWRYVYENPWRKRTP